MYFIVQLWIQTSIKSIFYFHIIKEIRKIIWKKYGPIFYSYRMKLIRLVTNLFWQALSYKEKGNLLLCLVIITQVGAQIITPTLEKDFLCYFILCCSWTNRKNGAFIITTTNNNSKRLHIWRRLYDFWLFSAQHH